jgi:hypothetical protein
MAPFKGGDQESLSPQFSWPQASRTPALPHRLPLLAYSGDRSDARTWSHPHPREARVPSASESRTRCAHRHATFRSVRIATPPTRPEQPTCMHKPLTLRQAGGMGRAARTSDLGIRSPRSQIAANCSRLNMPANGCFRHCNKLQGTAPCGDKPVRAPYAQRRVRGPPACDVPSSSLTH